MPEINEADRDAVASPQDITAFHNWNMIASVDLPIQDEIALMKAFAAHREAAVAEEQKRIAGICREIASAADRSIDGLRDTHDVSMQQGRRNCAEDIADLLATTTPPEPRPLTAEEIKAAIPANGHDGLNYTANYSKRLRWCHKRNGEFEISIDEKPLSLESLTDAKLAEIVAALGISEGVKHG